MSVPLTPPARQPLPPFRHTRPCPLPPSLSVSWLPQSRLPALHPLQGRDRLLYAVFASCELEVRTAPIFKVGTRLRPVA